MKSMLEFNAIVKDRATGIEGYIPVWGYSLKEVKRDAKHMIDRTKYEILAIKYA